ncbi:MAG: hypothetical protein ACI87O_001924 [Planctomycetota bacterium]|jgi:LysM repeat protein
MRVFLGIAVLGSLFLMAAFWQKGITRRLQQKRTYEQGQGTMEGRAESRWANLVLGRPSGADPLPAPVQLNPGPAPLILDQEQQPWPEPEPDIEPDIQYVVQPGDVLGTICVGRYSTARDRVLKAVAQYNDLQDPDNLKQGQVLALPALEVLFPGGL